MEFDELWPGGPRFPASGAGFRACTDSVLLASFVRERRIGAFMDLGCGGGVLTLLLSKKLPNSLIGGIEINPDAAELCRACLAENGAEHFDILTGDLRGHRALMKAGSYDLVASNPPYYPKNGGKLPADAAKAVSRSELCCTLGDICAAAAYLCRWGGLFYMVHKPERLAEVFFELKTRGLEPKRLRLVQNKADSVPSLALIESLRGGAPGLTVEQPLILTEIDGSESAEIREIYHRGKDT